MSAKVPQFNLSSKPEPAAPTPDELLATVVDVFSKYFAAIVASDPNVDDMLDHAKAMQSFKRDVVDSALAAMKTPTETWINANGTDGRYTNPHGVKGTIYTSNRVTWDRPALESELGERVDNFRTVKKVSTFKIK